MVCASDALLKAAERGDLDAVERRLEADSVDYSNSKGTTALHKAASEGHVDVVRALLAAGAFVDVAEFDGDTPLLNAAYSGHAEVVRILLEAGADESIKSSQGKTAIQHARARKHREVVRALREATATRRAARTNGSASGSASGYADLPADSNRRAAARPTTPMKSYRPGYEKRVAAVIGVNAYDEWPKLSGARPDAERMADKLRDLGFEEVLELYDEKATRAGILELLGRRLDETVGPNDLVMIYFAGHGQTETIEGGAKRGYIVPVDASIEDAFSTAIPMRTLRQLSSRLAAKHVYYAMDSCYSGLGFTRGISVVKPGEPDYISKVTSLRAVQMVTAGGEGEEAIERAGQGVFSKNLMEALDGKADANGDGFVTATEIGVYVRPRVTNQTGARQSPQIGRLEGEGEVAFDIRPRGKRSR